MRGAMRPEYWESCYTAEPPYPVRFAGTDPLNEDTDGDHIRDGADDQDHDDVPNLIELSRFDASHLIDWKAGSPCRVMAIFDQAGA